MQAVIRRGTELVCERIEAPKPGAGQVLVNTLVCGICGSDLHALHYADRMAEMARKAGGEPFDPQKDMVFGHEFCAEIVDFGPGCSGTLKPGTHVVSMPILMMPDGTAQSIGYSNSHPGGFAEQMVLSEAFLLPVPNGLSPTIAALTEPFAVGAHAVAEAQMEKGAVAVVIGCGPVGLAVIAALKKEGHGPVIASDYSPGRRALAEIFGADIVVDPAVESPHTKWAEHGVPTNGGMAAMAKMMGTWKRPVIFECVGVRGVLQELIAAAPPSARIVVVGVCMESDVIEPFLAITKQLDLRFVLGYTPQEFAGTLADIAEGRLAVEPIITGQVGLSGVADAFKALGNPDKQAKILVTHG